MVRRRRSRKTKRNYGPWGALESLWKPKRRPQKRSGFTFFKKRSRKQISPIRWLFRWVFILLIWALTIATLIVLYYAYDLPDISQLQDTTQTPKVTVLADGDEKHTSVILASYGDLMGSYVHVDELPVYVTHAILATEDRRFYTHFGIDVIGLLRAAYANYRAGRVVQGGSTITQQLAKNLFLTPDRTIKRKVQEMVLALWLEKHFSKDEILTIYLNRVYLGAGNYGIDAASRFYFGKPAQHVNLYEAAILAGLLKAPSRYSPTNNPQKAEQRANQVLMNMKEANYLQMYNHVDRDYAEVKVRHDGRGVLKNLYFSDWIVGELPNYIGSVNENISIDTTLNVRLQQIAEATVVDYVRDHGAKYGFSQAAVVGLSFDGEVLTMVGGVDYQKSQFNRASKALRQPGSAFKLFVYLAALEKGLLPEDVVIDEPFIGKDGYAPNNYSGSYLGAITVREAFAHSVNTIAVKLASNIGISVVERLAHRLGVSADMAGDLSVALGSSEMSLLELAQAYVHIASGGEKVRAYAVRSIHDEDNILLYEHSFDKKRVLLNHNTVNSMRSMLAEVVLAGTGKNADSDYTLGGKTGTSQDYRDAWFVGYAPDMVLAVWVGNDDNTPMKGVTGGTIPAQIFKDIVLTYYKVA